MKQIKSISTDVRMNQRKLIGIRTGDRQARCLLTVAVLVVATAAVLGAAAVNRNSAANTTAAVTAASLPGAEVVVRRPEEKIRAELVTAFPYGFEPDEITRPQGAFMLCVDNRAGTEALSLQLISGANGTISGANAPVYAEPIERGKTGTHKMLNLAPGQYILREGSHPRWFCTITITPR